MFLHPYYAIFVSLQVRLLPYIHTPKIPLQHRDSSRVGQNPPTLLFPLPGHCCPFSAWEKGPGEREPHRQQREAFSGSYPLLLPPPCPRYISLT